MGIFIKVRILNTGVGDRGDNAAAGVSRFPCWLVQAVCCRNQQILHNDRGKRCSKMEKYFDENINILFSSGKAANKVKLDSICSHVKAKLSLTLLLKKRWQEQPGTGCRFCLIIIRLCWFLRWSKTLTLSKCAFQTGLQLLFALLLFCWLISQAMNRLVWKMS